MKITNSDIIQSGEKGLIDAVTSDIDWGMIREVLRNKYQLELEDGDVEYRAGDLVVHDNQVAYKLDFDVKITLSVLLNRQGECFDVDVIRSATGSRATSPDDAFDTGAGAAPDTAQASPPSSPAPDSVDTKVEENVAGVASAVEPASVAVHEPEEALENKEPPPAPSPQKDAPTPSQIADMIASINRD